MIVAFSLSPSNSDTEDASVHKSVSRAVKVVRDSGLPNQTNAMFTLIEGEWDEIFDVVKKATEAMQQGTKRVSLVLKADIRPGYTGQLTAKVERVEADLAESEPSTQLG